MRRLLAGIAFLTRLPVPARLALDSADVAKATLLFPLVGALIGGIEAAAANALARHLPSAVVAVVVLALAALLTGALHLDGLADTADGFGGGKTREDVLRIMRDHAVGAYGVVALCLLLALKIAALSALVGNGRAATALVLGAGLSRWATVPLARFSTHARPEGDGLGAPLVKGVGPTELFGATVLAIAGALALAGMVGAICLAAVALLTFVGGVYCHRRLGGVTGDTMGANSELCEALVYLLVLAMAM
jgi:adenosylcobinamide-GDP ribazoletransferase